MAASRGFQALRLPCEWLPPGVVLGSGATVNRELIKPPSWHEHDFLLVWLFITGLQEGGSLQNSMLFFKESEEFG